SAVRRGLLTAKPERRLLLALATGRCAHDLEELAATSGELLGQRFGPDRRRALHEASQTEAAIPLLQMPLRQREGRRLAMHRSRNYGGRKRLPGPATATAGRAGCAR